VDAHGRRERLEVSREKTGQSRGFTRVEITPWPLTGKKKREMPEVRERKKFGRSETTVNHTYESAQREGPRLEAQKKTKEDGGRKEKRES